MNQIIIRTDRLPELPDLLQLYQDVGWTAYTDQPEQLKAAIDHSLKVWTAWEGEKLVGLARVIGDGHTITYAQDLLVLEEYQGKGLGSKLLAAVMEEYRDVRQFVLLTGDEEKTEHFYRKNGLVPVGEYGGIAFTK